MKVIQGIATDRRPSPLKDAYLHFRLDRQGLPVPPRTLGRVLGRVRPAPTPPSPGGPFGGAVPKGHRSNGRGGL
jgi:hypothetical protein